MAKAFNGFVWVQPEDKGWLGTSTAIRGQFLYADSESLGINKDIRERPNKITYGRALKSSTRVMGKQSPGGDIEFQFRSEDLPHILMAHYQKFIGTAFGTAAGSCQYTFVPEKGIPNYTGGSAFGTGVYTAAAGDLFTVTVGKKFFNTTQNGGTNAQLFKSCVVDDLEFKLDANDDAKLKASFKAGNVDVGTAIALNDNSALGSYSVKPSFESWSGTIFYDGGTLELNKLSIMSKNNLDERLVIGKLNPTNYRFGRIEVSGSLDLDMPFDGMKYFGSQLSGSSFAITATLYNSANDWVTFNMPKCCFKPFEAQLKGGAETTFTLPFVAYESDDGSTAPITVTVQTSTWGSTPVTRV